MALTAKQVRFSQEYIVDLCATHAAIRAGYASSVANVTGCKLLGNPDVAAAIQEAQDAQAKRTAITADRVLVEIARMAFAEGTVADKDKLKALELLGKHLGLLNERHEHSGPGGGPIETANMTPTDLARRAAFLLAQAPPTKD